jgi:hypothetical protein
VGDVRIDSTICPRCGQRVIVQADGMIAQHKWPLSKPGDRVIKCTGSLLPARQARA